MALTHYAFTPAFTSLDTLSDYYFRAAWYLKPTLDAGACVYFISPGLRRPDRVPDVLAPNLADTAARYSDQLRLVASAEHIPAEHRRALQWLCHNSSVALRPTLPQRLLKERPTYVDHDRSQFASSLWLRLSSNGGKGTAEQLRTASARFRALAESCKAPRAFLFGTGPTFDEVELDRLPPGLRIATNSMVVNNAVMERLQPQLIIASDPIFHAGPSKYAYEFRHHLVSAMERYDAHFIFPMRDVGVYFAHLPSHLHDKLIAVPIGPPGEINNRLTEALVTASTANVMTLLLLPVAASLTRELILGGFDGRPLQDNDYFWQHSASVQISNEMDSIRKAHPAFFAIDYDDYYFAHVEIVRRYLDTLEAAGYAVRSITPSHVPCLQARYRRTTSTVAKKAPPDVSLIMPNYNSGRFIIQAIDSVLQQQDVTWELIVVDDGSTDDSIDVARHYAATHAAIKVLEQTHGGVSAARNRGLEEARGRYCAFLDSDDQLTGRNSLSSRVAALTGSPGDAVVAGTVAMCDEEGRRLNALIDIASPISYRDVHKRSACINGVLGRTGILKQIQFPAGVRYGEDWQYLAELLRHGYRIQPLKLTVATYRMSASSATQQRMRQHILGVIQRLRAMEQDRLDGIYPSENRAGLDARLVNREIDCRYAQLITHSVLTGVSAKDVCALLDARLARGSGIAHCSGGVELVAMRAYRLACGSPALRSAVASDADHIRVAVGAQVRPFARLRPLAHAILRFVRFCEGQQAGGIEAQRAAAVFTVQEAQRKAARLIARTLYAVAP
jgi:hypothetical protein